MVLAVFVTAPDLFACKAAAGEDISILFGEGIGSGHIFSLSVRTIYALTSDIIV